MILKYVLNSEYEPNIGIWYTMSAGSFLPAVSGGLVYILVVFDLYRQISSN